MNPLRHPNKIRYRYTIDKDARLHTAHGVWGGINPQGEIELNFYHESDALPQSTECLVSPDGSLGPENLPEGFEQRGIRVEDGNLNVHFWQEEHFAFAVEQVANEPQLEQATVQTTPKAKPSQPAKKYEITDIAHPIYPELHRIRALRQVGTDVPVGELGGYVQSEANLSQEDDDAWIYGEAICRDDALVRDGAFLTDYAQASGSALIEKEAEVGGWAKVRDNAVVSGGLVQENALICGDAILRKSQRTGYAPMVEGNATVMGTVSGAVHLMGEAFILPGGVLENPTADVLGIHGTHAHLYRTETPDRPKSPKHLER